MSTFACSNVAEDQSLSTSSDCESWPVLNSSLSAACCSTVAWCMLALAPIGWLLLTMDQLVFNWSCVPKALKDPATPPRASAQSLRNCSTTWGSPLKRWTPFWETERTARWWSAPVSERCDIAVKFGWHKDDQTCLKSFEPSLPYSLLFLRLAIFGHQFGKWCRLVAVMPYCSTGINHHSSFRIILCQKDLCSAHESLNFGNYSVRKPRISLASFRWLKPMCR